MAYNSVEYFSITKTFTAVHGLEDTEMKYYSDQTLDIQYTATLQPQKLLT